MRRKMTDKKIKIAIRIAEYTGTYIMDTTYIPDHSKCNIYRNLFLEKMLNRGMGGGSINTLSDHDSVWT